MTDCLDFRRRVGAEPFARDADLEAHRGACAACARHQDELRAMDGVIRRALAVEPRPREAAPAAAPAGASRRRTFAIAASLAAGAAVGFALLVGSPRAATAREVIGHVAHEPGATGGTAPVSAAALEEVLGPAGIRIRPGIGDVSFATTCVYGGREVPHLVVQTKEGPVTVLVLRHRALAKPLPISGLGYEGMALPAPQGSIAVVGAGVADVEGVARKVFESIDWQR
jgi:hypothetical protein